MIPSSHLTWLLKFFGVSADSHLIGNLSLPNFCLSFGNAFYAMRTLSNVIAIQNSRQVYFAFIQPKIVGGTKCLGNLSDAIKDLLLQKKLLGWLQNHHLVTCLCRQQINITRSIFCMI